MDSDNGDAPSGETNGDGGNDAGKSMSHFNKLDRLVQKLHDSADQSREPSPVPEDGKTSEKATSGDEDDKTEITKFNVEESNSVEKTKKNKEGEEDDADTKEEAMETSKDADDHEKEAGEEKDCTTPARDQSVTPPPEGGSSSSRRKASRRKPTKTRKVIETESEVPMDVGGGDFFEDEVEAEYAATSPVPNGTGTDSNSKPNTPRPDTPGSAASPAPGPSGEPAESIDVDEHGNYILPEGTVLVEPEEVREEKNPVFKGPEFQAPKKTTQKAVAAAGGDLSNVRCTACSKQINPNNGGAAKRHPVLKVLICKKCYNWYASDEIEQDSNGIDEQCRWCGDGGNLICCDYCHNAFCKNCIKRNLGRAELSKILEADDDMKWHCYVCDPKPMANLIVHCTRIISAIDEYQRKEIEKKKQKEIKPLVRQSPKPAVMTQGVHMPQQLTVGPGRTLTPTGRGVTSSRQPPQPVLLTQVPNLKGGGFQLVSVPVGKQGSHRGGMVQKAVASTTVRQQLEQKRSQPQTGYRPADSQMWNIPITELNVTHVLERAMAITQSMNMLLGSLKDDLKPTQRSSDPNLVSRAKREVAVKLKRAMTAYRKSFNDIETYARNLMQVKAQQARSLQSKVQVQQQQQHMSRRSPQVAPRAVMRPTGSVLGKVVQRPARPQPKPMTPKPKPPSGPPEVIELSDSSEEEILPKKIRKSPPERKPETVESRSANNKIESTEKEKDGRDRDAPSKESEKEEPSKRRKSTSSEGGDSDEGKKKSFRLRVSLGGPGFSVKSSKKRRHSKDSQKSDDSLSDWGEREENGKERVEKDKDVEKVNGETDSQKDAEKEKKKTESDDEEEDREEEVKDAKDKDEKDPQDDDDSKDGSKEGGNQNHEEESDGKKDHEESKEPDEDGGAEEGEETSGGKNESMEVDKEEDSSQDKGCDASPRSDKTSSNSPITEPPQLDGAHDHDLPAGREQVERPLKSSKVGVSQDRSGADDEDDDDDDDLFGHFDYEPLFEFPTIVSAEDLVEGDADLGSVEENEQEEIRREEAASDSEQEESSRSTRRAGKGKISVRSRRKQSPSSSKESKSRRDESTSEQEMEAESKDRRTRKGKTVSPRRSPKSKASRSPAPAEAESDSDDESEESGKKERGQSPATVSPRRNPKSKASRSPAPAEADSDSDDESEESGKKEKRGRSPAAFQRRSRADIEAQRMLHKELLDEESEEASEEDHEDVEEDSSEEPEEDDSRQKSSESSSDYNPKEDVIWDRRNRTKDRQKKMKEKFKKLRAERLKKQKQKREKEEKKEKLKAKEKKKKKSEKAEVSSGEDSDEDESPKKKTADKESKSKAGKSGKKVKAEADSSSEEEVKVKEERSKTKKEKKKKTPTKSADSSAEDFEDEKKPKDSSSKQKKELKSSRRQKSTKSKKPDADSDADSESSGAELDKEIKRLEKMPKLSVKLKRLKDEDGDGEGSKNQDSRKESKSLDKKQKGKRHTQKDKRDEMIEELSSASEAEQADDDEEDNSEQEEEEAAAEAVAMDTEVAEDNEDARARRALLFEDSDDEDADNNMSSDSDLEQIKKAKEAKAENASKKQKSKVKANSGSEAVDADSSDSDVGPSPKKVTFKQTKLLRTKLSDDDDFESGSESGQSKRKTKKTGKKSRDDDSEEDDDLDTNNSPSDSDFESLRKKKKKKKGKNDSDLETDSDEEKKEKKSKKGKKGKKRKRIKMASDSSEGEEDTDSDAPKRKKKKKKKGSDDSEDEENISDEDMTPGKKRKHIRKILKDKKISSGAKEAAKAEEERRKRVTVKQKLYNEVTVEDASSPTKCPITTKLVLEMDEDKKSIIEVKEDLIRKLKPHQVQAVRFLWDCCVEDLGRLKKEDGSGCILAHCMGLGKTLSVIAFVHTLMRKKNRRKTNIKTCMVVCPLNTVLNWQSEFDKWLGEDDMLDVYELSSIKNNESRADLLRLWQEGGGIMILGYDMYRNLSNCRTIRKKKLKQTMEETLVDPGPDIVVCDEGHILKNDATGLSKAMNRIHTRRRIVLTGTPLQNNLVEYHCMVDFVKPKLLGTRKEFLNRFVNPIINGQCSDSTSHDVRVMKRRAHILHETLAGCVQRKDYSALTKFLMPKHEYVLSIRLSKTQIELYEKYLERARDTGQTYGKGGKLFNDYQHLMRIWTHPWVLKLSEIRQENKRQYDSESEDSFLDDGDSESEMKSTDSGSDQSVQALSDVDEWAPRKTRSARMADKASSEPQPGPSNVRPSRQRGSDSDTDSDFEEVVKGWKTSTRNGGDSTVSRRGRITEDDNQKDDPVSREWWAQYVSEEDKYKMELSGKLVILAEILKMCDAIGDKVLVFSQSLLSLDLIEDFLELWDSQSRSEDAKDHENEEEMIGLRKSWVSGSDYYRMDGSTSAQTRKRQAENFNDEENDRARLFLISTRAGGLGINLVAANRVIIFDASWNPSHDIQSIFRVYRFGQIKPVYVYRFLAQGTMEEKIYERQVTKESLSGRVIDEHQIERHFTQADLSELYNFTPDRLDDPNREERPIPELPEDRMLAELLTSHKDFIVQYHKHNSLLVNQVDQELTEEERKTAWDEYEQEKKGLRPPPGGGLPGPRLNPQLMAFQNQSAAHMNAWNNQIASQYQTPLLYQQQQSYMTNIERITKAIYHANPGISESDLQERVHHYIKVQQQQQAKRLREEQERYRLMVQQQQQAQYQMMYRQAHQSQSAGRSLLSGMLEPSRSSASGAPEVQEVDLTSHESAIQDMLRTAAGGASHEEAVQELLRAAQGKN